MQRFFPFKVTSIFSNKSILVPEVALNSTQLDFLKIIYFSGVSISKKFLHVRLTQQHG